MGMTALWWWVDRWRKSTAYTDMTAAEQGCYRNLLDEAWLRHGSLPNNDRILSKISGDSRAWKRARTAVLKHFSLGDDGCWHNATLDDILAKSTQIREWRAAAGQRGAASRWHNKAHGKANDKGYGKRYASGSGSGSGSDLKKKSGAGAPRRNRICPHSPRCATWTECTALILEEGRRTKAQS